MAMKRNPLLDRGLESGQLTSRRGQEELEGRCRRREAGEQREGRGSSERAESGREM